MRSIPVRVAISSFFFAICCYKAVFAFSVACGVEDVRKLAWLNLMAVVLYYLCAWCSISVSLLISTSFLSVLSTLSYCRAAIC